MEMSEQPLLISVYSRQHRKTASSSRKHLTFDCDLKVMTQELDS